MMAGPAPPAPPPRPDSSETLAFLLRYARTFFDSQLRRALFSERLVARDWQKIVEPKRYLAGAGIYFLAVTAWLTKDGAGEAIDQYGTDAQKLALLVGLATACQHLVLHFTKGDGSTLLRDRRFLTIVRAYFYAFSNMILIFATMRVLGPLLSPSLAGSVGLAFFIWAMLQLTVPIWAARPAYKVSSWGSFVSWWLGALAAFGLLAPFPRLLPFSENPAATPDRTECECEDRLGAG